MTKSRGSNSELKGGGGPVGTLGRNLKEVFSTKLKLGAGGQKAKRGSTPRTSLIPSHHSRSNSSLSDTQRSLNDLTQRLQNIHDNADIMSKQQEADEDEIPFRIKFVNNQHEATMADVYPSEEFKEIIQRVTEKLRMTSHSDYILMYKDTDDEEVGVACTDNLREMFSLFEPGSKLQLMIVPFNIIHTGALDSIAKIWGYGLSPNVFKETDDTVSLVTDVSVDSVVELEEIKLANKTPPPPLSTKPTTPQVEKPEMEEKLKNSGTTMESIADTAMEAAASATAALVAGNAAADAKLASSKSSIKPSSSSSSSSSKSSKKSSRYFSKVSSIHSDDTSYPMPDGKKAEPPTPPLQPVYSTVTTPKSSRPSSPVTGPEEAAANKDAEELRQAIVLMSKNLSLAIESLGTRLTTNFEKLSTEQTKIRGSLDHAKEQQAKLEECKEKLEKEEKVRKEKEEELKLRLEESFTYQTSCEVDRKQLSEMKEKAKEKEAKELAIAEAVAISEEAKRKAEEEAKTVRKELEEERAKRKAEEKAAKKRAKEEAEAKKKAEEEEEARKKKKAEEKAARKKAEEEAKKKAEEEEEERRKKREQAIKEKVEEAARKRREEEATKKKVEEEAAARKKAEEEARKKAEEEARKKAEEEAAAAAAAAAAKKKRAEEEAAAAAAAAAATAKKKAEEEAAAKKKAEEEEVIDIKVEVEEDVEVKKGKVEVEETIHIEVIDEAKEKQKKKEESNADAQMANLFKNNLMTANKNFGFPSNPYASSFFQQGFAELGMSSNFARPCLMQSPFCIQQPAGTARSITVCSCGGGGASSKSCSVCLTAKLTEMGYTVTESHVTSLLSTYKGNSSMVIDHVTR